MWRAVSYAATLTRYPVRQVYHVANSVWEMNRMSCTMLQQWTHELPRTKWTIMPRDTMWHSGNCQPQGSQSVFQSRKRSKPKPCSGAARADTVVDLSLKPNESMDRLVDSFFKPRLSEQEVIILPPVQNASTNGETLSASISAGRSVDTLVDVWTSAFTQAAARFEEIGSRQVTTTETKGMPIWPVKDASEAIDTAWAQPKSAKSKEAVPVIEPSKATPTLDLAAPIESHLLKESIARDLIDNLPQKPAKGTPTFENSAFSSKDATSSPVQDTLGDSVSKASNSSPVPNIRGDSASKVASSPPSRRRPLFSESAQESSLDPVPHDDTPLPGNEDNSQFSLPAEDNLPVPKWWGNLLDKVRKG